MPKKPKNQLVLVLKYTYLKCPNFSTSHLLSRDRKMVENIFRQKQWKIFSTKIAGKYFPVEKVFHRADEFSLSRKKVPTYILTTRVKSEQFLVYFLMWAIFGDFFQYWANFGWFFQCEQFLDEFLNVSNFWRIFKCEQFLDIVCRRGLFHARAHNPITESRVDYSMVHKKQMTMNLSFLTRISYPTIIFRVFLDPPL